MTPIQELIEQIKAIPRHIVQHSGQKYSYVYLDDVLGCIENLAASSAQDVKQAEPVATVDVTHGIYPYTFRGIARLPAGRHHLYASPQAPAQPQGEARRSHE